MVHMSTSLADNKRTCLTFVPVIADAVNINEFFLFGTLNLYSCYSQMEERTYGRTDNLLSQTATITGMWWRQRLKHLSLLSFEGSMNSMCHGLKQFPNYSLDRKSTSEPNKKYK